MLRACAIGRKVRGYELLEYIDINLPNPRIKTQPLARRRAQIHHTSQHILESAQFRDTPAHKLGFGPILDTQ